MCRIAGLYAFGDYLLSDDDMQCLTAMTAAMARRGPDAQRLWRSGDRRAAMGFRRLSIIDLSDASMQPFHGHRVGYVVRSNGEL